MGAVNGADFGLHEVWNLLELNKTFIGVVVFIILMSSACSPLSVEKVPVRAPVKFLLDIKSVVDFGDLSDIYEVSRRLGVVFKIEKVEPVWDDRGGECGYRIYADTLVRAKEYKQNPPFSYEIRKFEDGNGRIRVSFSVDNEKICVSSLDLIGVFGEGRKIASHRGYGWEYLFLIGDVEAGFSSSVDGCLGSVSLYQNR